VRKLTAADRKKVTAEAERLARFCQPDASSYEVRIKPST
jgi:hypothetical protein